ncbi:Ger(x)C family spore germination protein [Metabacillus halosaccharovorans]|uniref:Ger(X)C family spore germination protein n=1 Tax=Metabacillus halosaccharovorans TaxID=930124 RepID=A0ABT3DE78_9BACI|nr:Ger(x)C family spore germination protein [Metabacillus halosaccharovorans]MCV9885375.1 Ger(x)C family spore germination protein [Metabacillus halosaccharovorans]
MNTFLKYRLIVIKGLCLFISVVFLSGCWDSLDIEKRAVVLGIAIDKTNEEHGKEEENVSHLSNSFPRPDNEMIKITAQIAVPGKIPLGPESGGGDSDPVWILEVVGHTMDDALANLEQEISDDIFLGHLRIIIISEELARDGVERINDFFRRNSEVRRTAWLAISKGEASQFMKITPTFERVPGLYLSSMFENAVDLGKFPSDFIGEFWTILSSKGQDSFLPYISIKKEENVQIKGLAYFSGEKMVGISDPLEIGFFMAVLGNGKGGYGVFVQTPDSEDYVMVRISSRVVKIDTKIKDDQPEITVNINYEAEIDEKDAPEYVEIDDSKILKKIEEVTSKNTVESIQTFIKNTQEQESDIFGFGEHIRAKHPRFWDTKVKTPEKWHSLYRDLNVTVNCTTKIRRIGMKAK